jgi:four helix bundle protein
MRENPVQEKSYKFALNVIRLYRVLNKQKEYVIGRQLLKSGTSIGANIEEALAGQSRADFLSKMSIASKEARETAYWLRLIKDSHILDLSTISEYLKEADELVRMLTSIVKSTSSKKYAT